MEQLLLESCRCRAAMLVTGVQQSRLVAKDSYLIKPAAPPTVRVLPPEISRALLADSAIRSRGQQQRMHVFIVRRFALAEIPPAQLDVQLKQHKLEELDSKELWELTRKCHLFRSIDLSEWKGVSLLSFRSLSLAVGSTLQTVSKGGKPCSLFRMMQSTINVV